jgi:Holliday junction resolvase RusA-like endonuclease
LDFPIEEDEPAIREWVSPGIGRLTHFEVDCRFEIEAKVQVVSSQASSSAKAALRDAIRSLTRQCPSLLTCDVQINIRWWAPLRDRYEADSSADVDNIIKPIVDAISGTEGILINDCQLQSISSYWVTAQEHHSLDIMVKPADQMLILKHNIVFVEAMPRLYFPFDDGLPNGFNIRLLDMLAHTVEHRRSMEADGYDPTTINYMMPQQRFFHRTRVSDFRRMTLAEYRAQLLARGDCDYSDD